MLHCLLVCFLALMHSTVVFCETLSPECAAWEGIEENLKSESNHLLCTKNEACTGMNCSGTISEDDFHVGMEIHQCDNPSSIKIFADIPQLGIHKWQRAFSHGETFDLSGDIKGEFDLQKDKEKFVMGLSIKMMTSASKYLPKLLSVPLKFPVFHNITIPIPLCEEETHLTKQSIEAAVLKQSTTHKESAPVNTPMITTPVYALQNHTLPKGNCSINNSTCPPKELCQQLDILYKVGICTCIASYSRDENGHCIYNLDHLITTENPSNHGVPLPATSTSLSLLLTSILVPLTIITVLIALSYVAIRFRVFQYIRRRLRVQVYEQVLLGQEDDTDEQLADPVA